MVLKIERTDVGRWAPRPGRVPDADRQFGNLVPNSEKFRDAPVQAFGDTRGQLEVANSLANASKTLFDMAKSDHAMRVAEEDAELIRMRAEFGIAEAKLSQELQVEALEHGISPDEKYLQYQNRLSLARDSIYGDREFSTISQETIGTVVSQQEEKFKLNYYNGTILSDRLASTKSSQLLALDTMSENAAVAGSKLDLNKLNATLKEIEKAGMDPRFLALHPDAEAKLQLAGENAIKGFAKAAILTNPEGAIELLTSEEGLIAEILPADQRLELLEVADKTFRAKTAQAEKENRERQEDAMFNFLLRVEEGDQSATSAEAKRMGLDDDYTLRMIKARKAKDAANTKKGEDLTELRRMLEGGGNFAFVEGAKQKRQADNILNTAQGEVEARTDIDDVTKQRLIEDLAVQSVRLPPRVRASINAMGVSSDPESVTRAYASMKRMSERQPHLLNEMTEEARAVYDSIDINQTSENTAADAIAQTRAMRKMSGRERELHESRAKGYNDPDEATKFLQENLHSVFRFDPDTMPDAMLSDFQSAYHSSYMHTGNKSLAEKAALRAVQTNWSISTVTSEPTWMKNTPENLYSVPGQDNDWMKVELKRVSANIGFDYENVVLQPVPRADPNADKVWFIIDKTTGEVARDPKTNMFITFRPTRESFLKREAQLETHRQAIRDAMQGGPFTPEGFKENQRLIKEHEQAIKTLQEQEFIKPEAATP